MLGLGIGVAFQEMFNGNQLVTGIAWVAGFVVSAVLIRVIGNRLNRYGNVHTLYDVPMQSYTWLAVVCSALALGMVLLVAL